MCTEPSAFGAKCVWQENAFPSVEKSLHDYADIRHVKKPNCRSDGLLPLVIRRLRRCRAAIEAAGHRIRFATARGPLNIASYLLGHSQFLLGIKTQPDEIHRLLTVITDFLVDWIGYQAETFDSIDGIFLLDDLIGFLRDDDFQQFALPYLKQVYESRDVRLRFLHNDAFGMVTARHLAAMGVNLFNFSFQHSVVEIARGGRAFGGSAGQHLAARRARPGEPRRRSPMYGRDDKLLGGSPSDHCFLRRRGAARRVQ